MRTDVRVGVTGQEIEIAIAHFNTSQFALIAETTLGKVTLPGHKLSRFNSTQLRKSDVN